MTPNAPKSKFESKIFAKLPGLGMVGRFITQNETGVNSSSLDILSRNNVRDIAEEVFKSSTPSMITEQFKLPEAPADKTYVLASVNGKIQWLETDSCEQ